MSVAEIKQELSRLTDAERLDLLEAIWASLENRGEIPSPAWHEEELRQRHEEVATGKAGFIPWDNAKDEVTRRTS
jgi:putative addiction module component (TIGR02574 family)